MPCVCLTSQSLGNYLVMKSSLNSTVSRLQTKLVILQLAPRLVLSRQTWQSLKMGSLFRPEGEGALLQPEKNSRRKRSRDCSPLTTYLLIQVDINNVISYIPALQHYFTLRADCFKASLVTVCLRAV